MSVGTGKDTGGLSAQATQSYTMHINTILNNALQHNPQLHIKMHNYTILYNAQSYTILNNALQHNPQLYIYTMHKLHNSKQCPEKVHKIHSSPHTHKIPLKLDFFDAPAIPLLGELFQSTHTCCTCCTCCIQCTLENVFTEFEHGSHV